MSYTVEDFQDLLRLLEQHPEWRAELRRQVLTEELLELPALTRQLAEGLAALTARVDALTARVGKLTETQARTEAQVGALAGRVADLTGEVLELRYARRGPAYFSRLARRLRVLDPGRFADELDEAVDAGRLTEGERDAILEADIVLSGTRRQDEVEIYLLVEVSAGIGRSGVRRAVERARLLEKVGRPVVPVVAERWIDPESDEQARSYGVWRVLDGRAIPPAQSASA
jgi:hypothetical protein